ncbi:hypothetical protein GmRootA79_37670 [Acidovorax sp. A79]
MALHGADLWSQPLGPHEVRNLLKDGWALAQSQAIIEFEQRYVAARVQTVVVAAILAGVGFQIHPHGGEGHAGLAQRDV